MSSVDHARRAAEMQAAGNMEACAFHLQLHVRQLRKAGLSVSATLRQLGDVYFASGRYVRAAETYAQLDSGRAPSKASNMSDHVMLLYRLGVSLLLSGKRGAAAVLMRARAAVESQPLLTNSTQHAAVLLALGRALFRERSNAPAVAALEEGLNMLHQLDPNASPTEDVAILQMARDALLEDQKKETRRITFNNNPNAVSQSSAAEDKRELYSIN